MESHTMFARQRIGNKKSNWSFHGARLKDRKENQEGLCSWRWFGESFRWDLGLVEEVEEVESPWQFRFKDEKSAKKTQN